jgi:hypothetical protein
MLIKDIDVINIHYGHDDESQVWVKLRDMQEMAIDPSLDELPEMIEILRQARTNPGLQECLDRVKIVYRLGKR